MRPTLSLAILGGISLVPSACSSPLLQTSEKRTGNDYAYNSVTLALNTDFPDPAFVQHTNGTWFAFATSGNGERIQVAYSEDFVSWNLLSGVEALPTLSGWETENDHWAPDVFRRVCSTLTTSFRFVYGEKRLTRRQKKRTMANTSCTIPPSPKKTQAVTASASL